jgi:hypothetical protein
VTVSILSASGKFTILLRDLFVKVTALTVTVACKKRSPESGLKIFQASSQLEQFVATGYRTWWISYVVIIEIRVNSLVIYLLLFIYDNYLDDWIQTNTFH